MAEQDGHGGLDGGNGERSEPGGHSEPPGEPGGHSEPPGEPGGHSEPPGEPGRHGQPGAGTAAAPMADGLRAGGRRTGGMPTRFRGKAQARYATGPPPDHEPGSPAKPSLYGRPRPTGATVEPRPEVRVDLPDAGEVGSGDVDVDLFEPFLAEPVGMPARFLPLPRSVSPPAPSPPPTAVVPADGVQPVNEPVEPQPVLHAPSRQPAEPAAPEAAAGPEQAGDSVAADPGELPPASSPVWTVEGPVPASFAAPAPFVRAPLRGDSALQRAGRVVGRVAGLVPELREHAEDVGAIQAPVTSCRRIGVVGIRGGCGKSTVAALLGLVYTAHRTDAVLAVDADGQPGSLDLRLGSPTRDIPQWTLEDGTPHSFGDVALHLGRTYSGLWVLQDPADMRAALAALDPYFALVVVDRGCRPARARGAQPLGDWHSLIYVAGATVDGVLSARRGLEALADARPDVLRRTVVVLNEVNPHTGVKVDAAVGELTVGGAVVAPLPYDRHLASGGTVDVALLARSTWPAVRRAAALALNRAVPAERAGTDR